MEVYWLDQTEADVPPQDGWLSAREVDHLRGMRFAKRRADWRLGRWTAKRAVSAYLDMPRYWAALARIELRPTASGAPDVFCGERQAAVALSLSHSAGRAVCAVAEPEVALGCDLEVVEPRSSAFASDYFTLEEQAWVARQSEADRSRLLTLFWSAKESALKALRVGLRIDTRCLSVSIDGWRQYPADCWRPLVVRHANGQIFRGWWQSETNVLTTVSAPAPLQPIPLGQSLSTAIISL